MRPNNQYPISERKFLIRIVRNRRVPNREDRSGRGGDRFSTDSGTRRLDIIRRLTLFPGELVKRRLIASFPVVIHWNIKLLTLVILDAHTVLIVPAVALSINTTRLHGLGVYSLRAHKPHSGRSRGTASADNAKVRVLWF
jgi:hypothetical protein